MVGGYISNAEINEIISLGDDGVHQVYDGASDSDMLFYGGNWVAYMDENLKTRRTQHYQELKFGGTIDWALDLASYTSSDGDPEGDDVEDPDTTPLSPCDAKYETLEDLDAAASSIPKHCVGVYTVGVLNNLLTVAMNNYTNLMAHGYDKKFNTYSKAVAETAFLTLHKFVEGHGNKYFSCVVTEPSICCERCKQEKQLSPSYCDYCFTGKCYKECRNNICGRDPMMEERDGISPGQQLILNFVNKTEPCPPDYSMRGYGPDNPYEQTVYWTMTNETGFYADMTDDTGIPKNKTKIGNYGRQNACMPDSKPDSSCWSIGMDFNIPVIDGYSASDVSNPKEIVTKALEKTQTLGTQISDVLFTLQMSGWAGDVTTLIDSISLPVLMIASATESMEQVAEVADEIEEAKRKAIIFAFLFAILIFIPVVGEIAGTAGLADLALALRLAETVGNAGMDIYSIVEDPKNAPLAIFGLVLAPLALADAAVLAKAANARRAMREEDIVRLGGKISTRMKIIEKIKGKCKVQL
jgi:hypothetical protein